uniref:Alcohol dehydrogenase-like C-terminal domain-containing protein n=1 Tax=Callithrix jacchus TaxID=9483 RepID=A0A5F4WMI6_CALJA
MPTNVNLVPGVFLFLFSSSRLHLQRCPTGGSRARSGSAAGEAGRPGPELPHQRWVLAAGELSPEASEDALPVSRGGVALSGPSGRSLAAPPRPSFGPVLGMAAILCRQCLPRGWLCRCNSDSSLSPASSPGVPWRCCPSDPALVLCCRRARQGCGRHYRAAICAELKKPLTIEEVAPRPVGPHEVIAAAGSDEKCKLVLQRGAQSSVNYNQGSLKDAVRKLVGEGGVNVAIDMVGGDIFLEALRSLAWEGRIVVVGFAGGNIASVPANLLLLKNVSALGLFYGQYKERKFPVFSKSLSSLLQYCQQGCIQPYVGMVFKLEEVNDAFLHVIQGKSMGKVLLALK